MNIIGIDPGPVKSAWVYLQSGKMVRAWNIGPNEVMIRSAASYHCNCVAIEIIEPRGMAVGFETFMTMFWAGRFSEAFDASADVVLIKRRDIKTHICGTSRAKDANVRQAIIDRFGGKDAAIGKKKTPGPLYGIKADAWAALAVALTLHDRMEEENGNTEATNWPPA